MAFVNEYISKEVYEKFGIGKIDSEIFPMGMKRRDWTVDHERNIYLRQIDVGREEFSRIAIWLFYWKGALLRFEREGLGVEKGSDGVWHAHSRISWLDFPKGLQAHEQEIKQSLVEAFRVYGGGGVFSTSTDYVHDLEFGE